jgi:EAL domain-containing protein (putative c-di-GMP-specific phosphodiesterase class I)
MLVALHCEFAQGFLFSEPLSPERLDAFLDRRDDFQAVSPEAGAHDPQ